MTIAKSGPAGYEHQYRVSSLLGLLYLDQGAQLFIESLGEEDATLRRAYDGRDSMIEIQIKSSRNEVGLRELADMLVTFPKGKSTDCLFERLIRDPSRTVFVMCAGRCRDALSELVVSLGALPAVPSTHGPLGSAHARALLDAIAVAYQVGEKTKLRELRSLKCSELSKNTGLGAFQAITQRVVVIEQTDTGRVLEEIRRILVRRHRVPETIAEVLADAPLRRLVEHARDSGADLMPTLLKEVQRNQRDAIFPQQPYLTHAYEDELESELIRMHSVLLTGLPLCGKTQLACSLASRAQAQGFHVVKKQRVDEAYRFLLDPASGESRLVLLEDPFGKVAASRDGREDWARLAELMEELKPHRRLIVTARNDILNTLTGSTDPTKWKILGVPWVDVSARARPSLVREAWEAWANAQGRDAEEVTALSHRFGSGMLARLQPGHASFLARDRERDYRNLGDLEVVALARKDAAELSRELSSSVDGEQVLRGLGSSATTVDGPDESTLAFILDNELAVWPGLRPKGLDEITSLPRIPDNLIVRPGAIAILNEFERRGVIEWRAGRCRFTHPLWEDCGVYALLGTGHFSAREVKRVIENSLLCGDAATSCNAVAALARVGAGSSVGWEFSPGMMDLMLEATESIFPRVVDAAIAFLLQNLERFGEDERQKIIRCTENGQYSHRLLRWQNGVAWLARRADSYNPFSRVREDAERKGKINDLCQSSEVKDFSPEQLLDIYNFASDFNQESVAHLERGLVVEEAIVRAEAHFLLARYHWKSHSDRIRQGLSASHPRVVVKTMMGLALAWFSIDAGLRRQWLNVLTARLRGVGYGFVALEELLRFRKWAGWNPEWYKGKTASWDLWCECMIAALSTDPGYFGIDEAKLYDLIEQAMDEVPVDKAVELCCAWLDWTVRRSACHIPSDYGGSIAQSLLRATGEDAVARGAIVSRMAEQIDTALQVLLLRDLCRGWGSLSDEERGVVLHCFSSGRSDVRWMKAVVLVDGELPGEILGEIVGCSDPLSLPPVAVVEHFSDELLSDALHVFCGRPQPLWYIGTHHVKGDFWRPVLLCIASVPEHSLFGFAVRELLRLDDVDGHGVCVWEVLCRTAGEVTVQVLFEALLEETMTNASAPLGVYWWLLVRSSCASLLRPMWAKAVAEDIEAIGYSDNTVMVFSHLPEAMEHLPGEMICWHLCIMLSSSVDDGVSGLGIRSGDESVVSLARTVLERTPPRAVDTLDLLIGIVEGHGGTTPREGPPTSDPVLDAARARRRDAIGKGAARVRALSLDGPPPPGWHSPRFQSVEAHDLEDH